MFLKPYLLTAEAGRVVGTKKLFMKKLRILLNVNALSVAALNSLKELEEKGFIQGGMIVYEDDQENEVKTILDRMVK